MSTEVRRVPVDFDWPINEVWGGYLCPLPELPKCIACDGTGLSPEAYAIENTFYPHQIGGDREHAERLAWRDKLGQAEVDNLIAEGRLRLYDPEKKRSVEASEMGVTITAAMVNEANGPGSSILGLMAHDAINRWILVEFRCKQLGIELKCSACEGEGDVGTKAQREQRENWKRTEPPTGEGWQLWETVSEGAPVSPVFATADALVDHLTTFGYWSRGPMRREAAEALIRVGSSAGSFMTVNDGKGNVELLDGTHDLDKIEAR